jgi:putative tryptophan/tyrosine transport system substrate-binding protein
MRRRDVVALIGGAAAWPRSVRAQQPANMPRIGFLGNSSAALEANLVGAFREGLRDLAYVEEANIAIEYRWAEGNYERFASLIAELLGRNVAVIVTAGTPASLAVKKATKSVPLVMVGVGDPVATGLVASLARPGSNVTGLTSTAEETEGKRWELLKELKPELSHVAVLWNPDNPTLLSQLKELRIAAQVFGIKVLVLSVRNLTEIEERLQAIIGEQPGALIVMGDRLFLHNRQSIMDFATKHRLLVVPVHPELVETGGLMSYGPSYPGMHRRAAYFVDKILKGTKPADLPVERPTKFLLVLNLKAANTLGLTIPPSLLARADEVIE